MYDPVNRWHIIDCRYCGQSFRTHCGLRRYCTDQCYIHAHPYRPPRYPLWSHQEVRILRALAGEMPAKEIAARLGRTVEAVKTKAYKLRISLILYGEHCPWSKYSDALVEEIRTLYDEGVMPNIIVRNFGISRYTINGFIYYRDRLGPPIERYL